MNLDDYTDQQERLTRLEAIENNAQWLQENWESADTTTIAKRLGLIDGDVDKLIGLLSE